MASRLSNVRDNGTVLRPLVYSQKAIFQEVWSPRVRLPRGITKYEVKLVIRLISSLLPLFSQEFGLSNQDSNSQPPDSKLCALTTRLLSDIEL